MRSTAVRSCLARLTGDARGANLVEYVVLVGLVAILALAGFRFFGNSVRAKVDRQSMTVQTSVPHTSN